MAFPTTAILSTFTGTENPLSEGGNWTSSPHVANPLQKNDVAFGSNGSSVYSGSHWTASFSGNVEVYVTLPTVGINGHEFYMSMYTDNGVGVRDGYQVAVIKEAAVDSFQLYRFDDGTPTPLGDVFNEEFAAGVSIGLERKDGVIAVYVKPSGGSWTQKFTQADATHGGPVVLELTVESDAMTLDDFGGGTIVVDPPEAAEGRIVPARLPNGRIITRRI